MDSKINNRYPHNCITGSTELQREVTDSFQNEPHIAKFSKPNIFNPHVTGFYISCKSSFLY